MPQGSLEGDGGRSSRPTQACIRGRDGHQHLTFPRYAYYSPKGRRPYAKVPRNRGANTTLLASMTLEGMGPCLAVEGTTTATVFEAYLKKVLTPSLRHGQSVVVDNLGAHKGERVRELIEEGVPTTVPAGVFAGLQSHRGSLLKDQGAFGEKPKPEPLKAWLRR